MTNYKQLFSQCFSVNHIHYEIVFINNHFEFFIDLHKSSDRRLYEYDPFEKWGEPVSEVSYKRSLS